MTYATPSHHARPFLLPPTPPPTSTYTSTHPAEPIRGQASCATNLASVNAFLASTNAFLARPNANLARPNANLARPNTCLAWGNAFRLSTHLPEASLETNQARIVAGEP